MHTSVTLDSKETIHYLEFGSGKTVIILPSLWVTSRSFERLGKEMGKYYHVLIPDIYRGKSTFPHTGTSIDAYASKLEEFIDRLQIKTYFLIGNSLSGFVATEFVFRHTPLPKKMILISTTVVPLGKKHQRMELSVGHIFLVIHNLFSFDGIRTNWMWYSDGFVNMCRHFRQVVTEGLIGLSITVKVRQRLPVPTKLIFALRDEFFPRDMVKRFPMIKNLDVECVDGRHGWFFLHEKELTNMIVRYFR
jgi:pimeloyl-ACP methyl ester carboxylesterase